MRENLLVPRPHDPQPIRRRQQRSRPAIVVLAIGLPVLLAIGGTLIYSNAAAVANPNCSLVVPPDPLSAAGLASPYVLKATNGGNGPCNESNAAQAAFVQGTVLDPATGKISVYNPLVLDAGQNPAVAPVVPTLPANAVVGVWFGFNGTNLTLVDSNGSLQAGKCVNGLGKSIFGQFAHCNAPAFFSAANAAISAGKLAVPPVGSAKDGQTCPTTRDFSIIDQDQSDNVTSSYLLFGKTTAQNTAANRAKLTGSQVQVNGSDNLLLDAFVDQALGCTPFQAPDLADNGTLTTSLALNELQAAAQQGAPVALVPPNDPMTLLNNNASAQKTTLYRAGVDQPPLANAGNLATTYCQNMITVQLARLQLDKGLDVKVGSPDPAAADNLFSFLAQRLNGSVTNLGCDKLLKIQNPVQVTLQNGIAVDAVFATCTFGGGNAANGANPGNANANAGTGANGNGKVRKSKAKRPTSPSTAPQSGSSAGAATVNPSPSPSASASPSLGAGRTPHRTRRSASASPTVSASTAASASPTTANAANVGACVFNGNAAATSGSATAAAGNGQAGKGTGNRRKAGAGASAQATATPQAANVPTRWPNPNVVGLPTGKRPHKY